MKRLWINFTGRSHCRRMSLEDFARAMAAAEEQGLDDRVYLAATEHDPAVVIFTAHITHLVEEEKKSEPASRVSR